jgi:Hypothetical glycosyl hydrolase family 15
VIRQLVRSRVSAAVVATLGALIFSVSGLGSAVGSAAINVGARVEVSAASVLQHFAPIYMGGQAIGSQSQAIALAEQYAVIAEKGAIFAPFISAMHHANPALKVVAYLNATFDTTRNGTAYPLTWYAHDGSGHRIQSRGTGNWLMDPTNPLWAPNVANLCRAALARSRDDGCFLDTLGLGPLGAGYVTGLPMDPSTHAAYSASTWIAAQTHTIAAVARVANVIMPNGLANGTQFLFTGPLLATSHLAMAETWLRLPGQSVSAFPTTAQWLAAVNMLADAEAHGWRVMTVTKLWTTATAAQVDQWHRFTVASFLMGAGGLGAYNFTISRTLAGVTAMNSDDRVAIGTPIGTYSLQSGVYERSFTNGIAVVNPGATPVAINFGTAYRNLIGDVVTHETLAPHTGDVLTRSAATSGATWNFGDGTTEDWAGANAHLVPSTAELYASAHSLRFTVSTNGPAYALSQHPFAGSRIFPFQPVSLSMYVMAGSAARYGQAILDWYTSTGSFISQTLGTPARSSTSKWTRYSVTGSAPSAAAFYATEYFVGNGSIAGEVLYIDLVTGIVG